MPNVKPVPDHMHTINVYLTVKNAPEAIEWYKKAFNATEHHRSLGPDGKSVMHCELRVGDSTFMLSDEFPEMSCKSPQTLGGTPMAMFMYVDNVDQVFENVTKAGAKVTMPLGDMFWGDRYGQVVDPYGHKWGIATHKEDLTPEQVKQRQEQFMKQTAGTHK
ncbi:MAG TPA: VOC family protein [Candidatus Obscuribacterales bacterium]